MNLMISKALLHAGGLPACILFALGLWSAMPAAACVQPAGENQPAEPDITDTDPAAAAEREAGLLSGVRQLTFEGRRAGEGYFNRDGSRMVFQSEREPDNPFFQIYLMDLETGDIERISPGHGKTTCAWIHPDGNKVLFASTHEDPEARRKQAKEIEDRKAGSQRRYSWDYDEQYEIYVYDRKAKTFANVTKIRGYDAEGSWSPDGRRIAFASNRRAYTEAMTEAERKKFEVDPAFMIDLYIMDSDGANVRRLTDAPGYDGGPFFSPDGKRICWRRFSENAATAEIMTMNVDGSDQRQLTELGAMSWAPFYHPSGEYLIFTTNQHGFANFELYLVDAAGEKAPVRATYTKGFDGLPVFSPDGNRLAWTSNRGPSKQSQIFLGDWNHQRASQLLGLGKQELLAKPTPAPDSQPAGAGDAAARAVEESRPEYLPEDVRRHVEYLCRPELAGRLTGTPGEELATAYAAACFERLGLKPASDKGSWFQPFEFNAGVSLGDGNRLAWGDRQYKLDEQWRPVAFSESRSFDAAPVVFAGYGISAPAGDEQDAYDSFVHLDVTGKWVLVFRYVPENTTPERRQQLSRYASLRYKTMLVRDKGARGLIVVSGPNAKVKEQLVPLRSDGSMAGASVPVISVADAVAQEWLAARGKSLKELQDKLDQGGPVMGFDLQGVQLAASIDIEHVKKVGRNVLGRLQAGAEPSKEIVLIGAHIDHLGAGASGSSLAKDDEKEGIHYGADDNASGVAALLEIAQHLADRKAAGKLDLRRDILFAAWSGEELGLFGSGHFAKSYQGKITACLNMDMVGRLDKKLVLQGVGSSSAWRSEIERSNVPVGLPVSLQEDSYLPTDATSFYTRGVPILSAFTGSHAEYHTPRDIPEKLNYEGAAKVARLMGLLARSLAIRDSPPDYVVQAAPKEHGARAGLRAYLGTIPDYAAEAKGVKLSGVSRESPADKAGLKGGDVIVELAGKKIENIYDYTYAIEALKIGQKAAIRVLRDRKEVAVEIVPASRE
ncbi:MAG: M20/M25/M40 family metallo-hydrolase [Pirellulales bacterium]|nr:M20/M25/M40 family metallo-hydrolase [Pirellulales bacterium]